MHKIETREDAVKLLGEYEGGGMWDAFVVEARCPLPILIPHYGVELLKIATDDTEGLQVYDETD